MHRLPLVLAFVFAASFAVLAEDKPIEPFNGKDLTGWTYKGGDAGKAKSKWRAGKASLDPANPAKFVVEDGTELVNAEGHSVDLCSEAKYGDAIIEVELMVPKGSNSGVYVHGEYEVQVLDSFGKPDDKMGMGDIGAIYGAAAPKVNASKAPGEWQKFVINFKAPKFDADGKKTANAVFVKVELNGKVLHENLEVKGPTPGGMTGKEMAQGPIMFQGDHGPVSYRNIKITPTK
jgi:hypothetical protein